MDLRNFKRVFLKTLKVFKIDKVFKIILKANGSNNFIFFNEKEEFFGNTEPN